MSAKVLDVGSGRVRNVRLSGRLGAKFGRMHRMAVASAAEAVRALGAQLEGFDAYLIESKDKGMAYAVFYGKKNISKEQLQVPAGDDDIRIAPIMAGAKEGGWLQIILGIVLVVVGMMSVVIDWSGTTAAALVTLGWGLIVGGVVQLLTPSPKGSAAADRPENQPGYVFGGPINTQAQGKPVQVLYGELIVGSAVLSAGITAVDQFYIPVGGRVNTGGGGSSKWSHAYEVQTGGV